jgi:hypothetical protein
MTYLGTVRRFERGQNIYFFLAFTPRFSFFFLKEKYREGWAFITFQKQSQYKILP